MATPLKGDSNGEEENDRTRGSEEDPQDRQAYEAGIEEIDRLKEIGEREADRQLTREDYDAHWRHHFSPTEF